MGDPDWCNIYQVSYQSLPRTIVEALLCLVIVAAYVPQYLAIITQGTHGISPWYVLFHGLFSASTLALRSCNRIHYNSVNCVKGGPYTGWKALSSLLGFIQSIVQFVAAMVLLGLFIRYRDSSDNDIAVDPSPLLGNISSRTLQVVVSTTSVFILSISLAFLWFNENERFDQDDPSCFGNWLLVYGLLLGFWQLLLVPANLVFVVLQFTQQINTIRALHSHVTLSLVSVAMQAAAFVLLAVMQAARGWSSIMWIDAGDFWPIWRFLGCFMALYGTIDIYMSYFLTGVGYLVLLAACLLQGRPEDAAGRIRL